MTRNRRSFICGVWNHRQLICTGLALSLYLVGLGRPPLWEPDEGRYAEIAREMVASHDYITPRDNFVRYFEKPPLVYWLTAASIKILGPNEFAVRLQAAIASAGQVAITGALGEQMFGAICGVLAALALALSPLFFAFARFATPDPALAFFFTAAMTCFYMCAQRSILYRRSLEKPSRPSACAQEPQESGRPWRMVSLPTLQEMPSVPPAQDPAEGIETRWMLAAAAMLALGTLTKGPVALVLGCTTATLWLVVEHRLDDVFNIPWFKCGALYLGIVLPWFILVARRNPGFLDFFIVHEHLKRFLESTEHSWGPWFYIPITIAGTWPWFYFVPLAIVGPVVRFGPRRLFAKRIISQQGSGADPKDRDPDAALRFLLIWFAVVVVFFSIPRSKLGQYILPGLPPIAILAGYGLTQTERLGTTHRRRLFMIFAGINISAAMAMTLAVVAVSGPLSQILRRDALILAAALFAAGGASMFFSTAGTGLATLALAISVLLEMSAGINARERVAPMVSYRKLARIIRPYTNRGCSLISYGHFEQALPFYTGAPETLVNYRGELGPFGPGRDPSGDVFATTAQLKRKWAGADCAVLVVNRSDVQTLAKLLSPVPTLIGYEGKKFAFFNRPVAKPASDCPDPAACRTEKSQCSYGILVRAGCAYKISGAGAVEVATICTESERCRSVDGSRVETLGAKQVPNASLGESLVAARKRRGLSRETAVQQTHIPAHYLQMLEDDDYRRICDRLYLLPFLRKYASFLEIDPEETAMRLLREVQRADESRSPAEVTEPLDDIRSARRRDWSTPLLFSGLIAVIVGAYAVQSRHNEPDTISVPKVQSGQPTIASSPSSLTDIVNPTAQAATTTATELGASGREQRASDTKATVSPSTHR